MNNAHFIAWRFYLILSVITFAVIGLIWRVFDLAILDQHFLRHQGDERALRMLGSHAFRGMILDRNGHPLAVSTPVYAAWMNPKTFTPSKEALSLLSQTLGIKPCEILNLYKKNKQKKREFVYLKRALSAEVADQIKSYHLPGIDLQQAYRRYYPEGEVASQVIGFTNIDDQGQEGLELAYNEWLAGQSGKTLVMKDRLGRVISDVQQVKEKKPGQDLILSIDKRIQYLAYRELQAGVIENKASSGSAIVMDVQTGEILAMVNQPSFDPNQRPVINKEAVRNRALTDTYEPGSTIKAFTITSALQSGLYRTDSVIDTSPGWMRVGHQVVKDEHNNGRLSVTQILQISSNMGVAKMILSLPPDQLWDLLHQLGLGEATGIGFPGEESGLLIKHHPWGSFTLATLSFGYGLSVTTLQLARAYAVIANEGVKLPVSLLRVSTPPTGQRVMQAKVAKEMLTLLESVVSKEGTAGLARVRGYRIAGKTGTAKKVGINGYEKHSYTASFVGIAPISHPRLVIAVVIHDPKGKNYYGGLVSGPVFQKIMEGTLRLLDIPPDAPITTTT